MTAAAAVRAALPACPECAGGGEVNGIPCRGCGGSTRTRGRVRRDWRAMFRRPALAVSGAVAVVTGAALRGVPGVGGAAAVSAGLGGIAGHVFGHGLTPWVAAVVAGCFGLMMDRRL